MQVLDKGYIELRDYMGSDLSVVRAARISYDAEWRTGEDEGKDERLIGYLLKNNHTSPFEHVIFTFEIKCPMFIGEQWLRHRTWSFNKISGRYSELDEEFYVPELDQITTQHSSNKQMRTEEQNPFAETIRESMEKMCSIDFRVYRRLIELGCPRELARGILPANTYTRMVASVDLHNLMHFLKLRLHEHAQYEIRVYAEAIMKLIEPIVPVTLKAFKTTL